MKKIGKGRKRTGRGNEEEKEKERKEGKGLTLGCEYLLNTWVSIRCRSGYPSFPFV